IAMYITKKYAGQGTKLYPDENNLKGFAMFEQACSLEENYFHIPAEGIAYEKIYKLMKGEGPTDEAQVAKYAARLDSTLAVYDRVLSKQKYPAGDEVTLADLLHLPYGKIVKALGFKGTFEKYANVDKWFVALEARESWIKVDL
ncbi:glutathione S-transferase, partial [Leptodontidium sp. MPI-SDFR-AT-0119]